MAYCRGQTPGWSSSSLAIHHASLQQVGHSLGLHDKAGHQEHALLAGGMIDLNHCRASCLIKGGSVEAPTARAKRSVFCILTAPACQNAFQFKLPESQQGLHVCALSQQRCSSCHAEQHIGCQQGTQSLCAALRAELQGGSSSRWYNQGMHCAWRRHHG